MKSAHGRSTDVWIVLGCLAVFAAAGIPVAGSMTDDSYIHLQYARNLAETGQLAFNRGEPSYGATSPLWVAILAALRLVGLGAVGWCRVLSWFFGAATVALLYRFVLRLDGRREVAACAALILAGEAWLLRWSSTGMETSLAAFAVLACLRAGLEVGRSARHSALFGLLLFLAVLARPEALLLVPLAAASFAAAGGGVSWRRRCVWLVVCAPLLVLWFLVIRAHTGTLLPLTAGAKQGRFALSGAALTGFLVALKIITATLLLPALAALALAAAWLLRDRRLLAGWRGSFPGGVLLACAWVFALPAVYVLLDFHLLSRYLLPVFPALAAAGTVGAARLFGGPALRRMRSVLAVFTAATMIQSLAFYAAVVVRPTREFTRGLEEVIAPIGVWLGENTPEGTVVAAPDIGAIGWYSRRTVLDLGGLVSPQINRMRREIDLERIIDQGLYLEFGPDYFVDRHGEPLRFEGAVIRGVRFEAVASGSVSNLGIRKPDPVTYVLYRLHPGREEMPEAGDGKGAR